MESQGAGMQVLMPASLAVRMGVPIYGIIAGVSTATDKEGRSVPAPGQGLLTTARQQALRADAVPILDPAYRAEQLAREFAQTAAWRDQERARIAAAAAAGAAPGTSLARQLADIDAAAERRNRAARQFWSSDCLANDVRIAPLRAALAVFGLDVDDIGVASFHGTGTAVRRQPRRSERNGGIGWLTGAILAAAWRAGARRPTTTTSRTC